MKEKENTVPTSRKKKVIYSVIVAVSALLLVAAIVLTAYFVTSGRRDVVDAPPVDSGDPPAGGQPPEGSGDKDDGKDDDKDDEGKEPNDPTTGEKVAFIAPIESAACSVEYFKIYENKTLDKWYYHKAVDYAAPEGTDVRSMADGKVTRISLSERLGNLIEVEHADGVKSTYRFVEPVSGLKEGDAVKQGQVIAKVAQAYGTEAKDGTHLHLEMEVNEKPVDPADYIDVTLEEK